MTALDDFKRFVADAESGSQFAKWAHDNPGDLGRWQAFRDVILAGKSPAVPAMTSPHGRELVDAGVLYLDTTAVAPPPPPPPPSGSVGNGFLTNLQGNSYAQMSDTERARYGGIIVGFGDYGNVATFAKAHPVVHGFGYQTSVESGGNNQFWYGAVADSVARQNGWVLKTAGGVEITNGYGYLMCDIGDPGYQKAWCDYVRGRVVSTGLQGKFLDNVTGTMMVGAWFHEGAPAGWSDATLKAAYLSMLNAQQVQLPGVYRLANAYDTDRLSWWKTIAPYVDGLLLEYFDGSDAHLACLKAAQDAGKDAWALVDPNHGQPPPDSAAGVALAQRFASVWNRKGGGFGFNGVGVWREGAGTWTSAISG